MRELHKRARRCTCPWKGAATYDSTEGVANVAWSFDEPEPAARKIKGYVASDTSKVEVA